MSSSSQDAEHNANATQVTELLHRIRGGDSRATDALMQLVYAQLYRLASRLPQDLGRTPTMGPTAIVHEAYVKLVRGDAIGSAENRHHFFALACRAMRQVIVDYARLKSAQKRSDDRQRVPLEAVLAYFDQRTWNVIALNDALESLANEYPRKAQVVELRFFGGLTTREIAECLSVSMSTVEGDWRFARAYIRCQMEAEAESE